MAGMIRYLLDEALDDDSELRETVMNAFGRPKTYDDMLANVRNLPNNVREMAFKQVIAYKKYMSGGNFNIAAAYVQLATLFYESLEVGSDSLRDEWLRACRLFTLDADNNVIREGIGMSVKLGMV
jgi:hypothetical protein